MLATERKGCVHLRMSRRVEYVHTATGVAAPVERLSFVMAAGQAQLRASTPQPVSGIFKRTPKAPEPTVKEMVDEIHRFVRSGEQSELKRAAKELMLLDSRLSVNKEEAAMMGSLMDKQVRYLYSMVKLKEKKDAEAKKRGR